MTARYDIYVAAMIEAVDRYREAKTTYKWVTETYTCDDDGNEMEGAELVNAKTLAGRDPLVTGATKECEFWSQEALMYAAVITALRG
jgi:5'(3')-deoxyribonucleotidase